MESIEKKEGGLWEAKERCTVTIKEGSVFTCKDGDQTQPKTKTNKKIELNKGDSIVSVEPYKFTVEI